MSPRGSARRDFLRQLAALPCAGLLANRAWGAAEGADWSIPVLADLHFDRPEHHDHQWLAREHPGDVAQVENYCKITRERLPRLLERTAALCRQLSQQGSPPPFVLQLGDLLEGLCGSRELAERHLRDCLKVLGAAALPAPLWMTKGNHDITGPGSKEVYDELLVPRLTFAKASHRSGASFTNAQADTLFVWYDAYDRQSLDWFEQVVETARPKRLVVAIHPPVVPYNARSTWHVYASPKQQEQRTRLLSLLGRQRAIVLCGHLHKYSYLVRRTEEGRFVQLALSSVASTDDARASDVRQGVEQYGPDLVELEPKHAPETIDARRAILAEERKWIEHFEYANTWGLATVHSRGGRITADVYRGFAEQPASRLDLSGPLDG
jgi:hypothetical protein